MPYFDRDRLETEILKTVVELYESDDNKLHEVKYVADELEISALKARKLLITAGERAGDVNLYYRSDLSEAIQHLYVNGKSVAEIEAETGLSHASVVGYLPYTKTVYTMRQISVDAERIKRFRERQHALSALDQEIATGGVQKESDDWKSKLWKCIVLYQNFKFKTAGRGKEHKGAVEFQYSLKISSRTGETTDELIISTRPDGKNITRSSVELALMNAVAVQEEYGFVKGPKACGQIFGISYLYAIFLHWGLISASQSEP